jgi:RNA polymerase sigma-70 factor (ECF subfamily)
VPPSGFPRSCGLWFFVIKKVAADPPLDGTLFESPDNILVDVDDADLLKQACRGGEAEFCELFDRYQARLYQYALRMCGAAAADDIVQDTFMSILRPVHFDEAKGSVIAYLFGIARHHVIRRLSERGLAMEAGEKMQLDVPAVQGTPFDVVAREQGVVAVREAVESLPPLYREVIIFCDLQEMDYAKVAAVIHCPIGTVRSRLHRARKLLAAKLRLDFSDTP